MKVVEINTIYVGNNKDYRKDWFDPSQEGVWVHIQPLENPKIIEIIELKNEQDIFHFIKKGEYSL